MGSEAVQLTRTVAWFKGKGKRPGPRLVYMYKIQRIVVKTAQQ